MFSAEGFHQSSAVRDGGRREEGERREGGGREEGERREGGGREEGGRREGGREGGGREEGGRREEMCHVSRCYGCTSKFCVLETLSHDLLAAPQMVYTAMYNSTVTSRTA